MNELTHISGSRTMRSPEFSPAFQQALTRWQVAYRAYADDETNDPAINQEEQAAEDALMAVPATTAAEFAAKLCAYTRWGDGIRWDGPSPWEECPLWEEAVRLSGIPPQLQSPSDLAKLHSPQPSAWAD